MYLYGLFVMLGVDPRHAGVAFPAAVRPCRRVDRVAGPRRARASARQYGPGARRLRAARHRRDEPGRTDPPPRALRLQDPAIPARPRQFLGDLARYRTALAHVQSPLRALRQPVAAGHRAAHTLCRRTDGDAAHRRPRHHALDPARRGRRDAARAARGQGRAPALARRGIGQHARRDAGAAAGDRRREPAGQHRAHRALCRFRRAVPGAVRL